MITSSGFIERRASRSLAGSRRTTVPRCTPSRCSGWSLVVTESNACTMFGWIRRAAARASRWKRGEARCGGEMLGEQLTATGRSRRSSNARCIVDIPARAEPALEPVATADEVALVGRCLRQPPLPCCRCRRRCTVAAVALTPPPVRPPSPDWLSGVVVVLVAVSVAPTASPPPGPACCPLVLVAPRRARRTAAVTPCRRPRYRRSCRRRCCARRPVRAGGAGEGRWPHVDCVAPVVPVGAGEFDGWQRGTRSCSACRRVCIRSLSSDASTLRGERGQLFWACVTAFAAALHWCGGARDPLERVRQARRVAQRDAPGRARAAAGERERAAGGERQRDARPCTTCAPHWPYSSRSASESGRRAARIAAAAPGDVVRAALRSGRAARRGRAASRWRPRIAVARLADAARDSAAVRPPRGRARCRRAAPRRSRAPPRGEGRRARRVNGRPGRCGGAAASRHSSASSIESTYSQTASRGLPWSSPTCSSAPDGRSDARNSSCSGESTYLVHRTAMPAPRENSSSGISPVTARS